MSAENVALTRQAFETFHRESWEGLFGTFWAPELVWDMTPTEVPGLGVYRGFDEVRSFFEKEWFSAFSFEEWQQDLKDVIDCGGDRVIAIAHQRGRGSASAASVDLEYLQLITIREGRMVRVETYLDRKKALEAAGLAE